MPDPTFPWANLVRSTGGPPQSVLGAFDVAESARHVAGGMGGTWRAGELVFKRSSAPQAWIAWEERLLAAVSTGHVRVQRLRRARDGALVVDGWVAREHLVGEHRPRAWSDIIDAGDAFHTALASVPLGLASLPRDARADPWAVADRIAWEEMPVPNDLAVGDEALRELVDARRPIDTGSQLVHGDLTGNVLFADGAPPAIIDFSPYWRPPAYAVGVVIADAVIWEGAGLELLHAAGDRAAMGPCLVRSLIFRHVSALLLPGRLPTGEAARRYARLRAAAIRLP